MNQNLAASLKINDEDASRLVGGVVEKGFSDVAPSLPLPTVLPFPVARHRSHGPYWKPIPDQDNAQTNHGDVEDDDHLARYHPISRLAKPLQRKEKKGMNFSKWRKIDAAAPNLVDSKSGVVPGKMLNRQAQQASDMDVSTQLNGVTGIKQKSNSKLASFQPELIENIIEKDEQRPARSVSYPDSSFSPSISVTEDAGMLIETQIDAETQARLERMSVDEISEAQAEIISKMRPELVQALRRRGQQKLKRKDAFGLDTTSGSEVNKLQSGKGCFNASQDSIVGSSDKPPKEELKDKTDSNAVPGSMPKRSTLWDAWTKRVEGVRELRFTIDGDIVEADPAQLPANPSCQNQFGEDNVFDRDYIRTDGDPGAAGYSIKDAVALCQSMVAGQRALALHLIASVLDKAVRNILQNRVGSTLNPAGVHASMDWEAIWAFALGPEPELALALRMCLDDNHSSVVLECAKVIQCVLCCDFNENYFDVSEKTAIVTEDVFTAPVFRSRPEIEFGFLYGGFWKYSTKPSNILQFRDGSTEEGAEGEPTIKDDLVVCSQDITAGLVRMGILPRILYLLETNPSGNLEEFLISILIAMARHSPTCAAEIMNCQRLVETIVNRFVMNDPTKTNPSKIKSVKLLKVLACTEKRNCADFISHGVFQKVMWHLYRPAFSIDQWGKSGKEACRLSSALLVEQLRFWKVCIKQGYGLSFFPDLFPSLSVWLDAPELGKLSEWDVLGEYAAMVKEMYLVFECLTRTLPNFYQTKDGRRNATIEKTESWSWSYIGHIVDLALKWTEVENIPYLSDFLVQKNDYKGAVVRSSTMDSLIWLISSVLHMLSGVLRAVIPQDVELMKGCIPWMPEFVPRIALAITTNGFLNFSKVNDGNIHYAKSFLASLCYLRQNGGEEASMASVCCLHGLVQVAHSADKLIQLANPNICEMISQSHASSEDDKIVANGILRSAQVELKYMLTTFMKLINSESQYMQLVATFSRGGPTPGVGVGWGASGGGYFSMSVLLAQLDARLLAYLLCISETDFPIESITTKDMGLLEMINSAMGACLVGGPRERLDVEMLFDFLFQGKVVGYLGNLISQFFHLKALKPFGWEYGDDEYQQFSSVLASHFRKRWLCRKNRVKSASKSLQAGQQLLKKGSAFLDTIHEEVNTSRIDNQEEMSLVQEWAHQRSPLPTHWFLSPMSIILQTKKVDLPPASNMVKDMEYSMRCLEVFKAGLFFSLSVEAMSAFVPSEFQCFVRHVPIVLKLHALSVMLMNGMTVLEEEKTRDVYETLQYIYGQYIDELIGIGGGEIISVGCLNFQSDISELYSTFIENLIEQFAAVSYGDLVFGRQIAIYLHMFVESPVKLATWMVLSKARALELLPPLEKCIGKADGYLLPVEDDEKMLEAYAQSWVSGALDRAATRGSAAFTLALHHLSSFIFGNCPASQLILRNKLVKSLLRDYSRKEHHKGMMLNFVRYKYSASSDPGGQGSYSLQISELENRFCVLKDACDGNSSLLREVEKLERECDVEG